MKSKKEILIVFILVLMLIGKQEISAQKSYISEEAEISNIMRQWIANNRNQETVRGWRIQIITTDDRRKMDETRGKFQGMYPDIPLSWEHESPYYKVQVGAYEKKLVLQQFLQQLKDDFPLAIPIMDDIKKSELIAQ